MITRLQIKGLAIIESLEIEFSPGFNVITGETGAGKSILILALHFLTGAKVSAEVVRSGSEVATVSGEFLVPDNHPVVFTLTNLGIPLEFAGEDAVLLLRRQLNAKGRSQAWVNDVAVSTQSLKELGALLVDVFAQHENQRLMNPAEHVRYLDQFSDNRVELKTVETLFRECAGTIEEIEKNVNLVKSSQRDRDYLIFRSEELKKFEPTVKDHLYVAELCESADKVVTERQVYTSALQGMENGDESAGALLWGVAKNLNELGESGSELRGRVESLAREVEEISFLLNQKVSSFDVDEKELERAQERHFGYQDLFRKHTVKEVQGLLEAMSRLQAEVTAIESSKEIIESLIAKLEKSTTALKVACERLSDTRKKASQILKTTVQKELQELSMAGARLDTEWNIIERNVPDLELQALHPSLDKEWQRVRSVLSHYSERGAEKVQFLLSSNPGEPSLPLVKVASGGELSRIMLALKKTLAADAETCVLVFDEIDTGISGSVADVVGKKMRELSKQFQVICISHLPQVAVYADTHCLVKKEGKKSRTETAIVRLTKEESAKEIARLLSGSEVTTSSLANAKNLIQVAHHKKQKHSARRPGPRP